MEDSFEMISALLAKADPRHFEGVPPPAGDDPTLALPGLSPILGQPFVGASEGGAFATTGNLIRPTLS